MTERDKQAHLLNLVSQGMTLNEARKRLGIPVPQTVTVEEVEPNEIDILRKQLDDLGIVYHHKAGVAKLRSLLMEGDLM